MTVPLPPQGSIYYDNPYLCTYATCPVWAFGQVAYIPSLGGNVFLLAIFAVALFAQIFLGIRYRTWGYMVAMIGGTGLEIVGYIGRIELHIDDFNNNYFIIYLVGLTIGPACFSAAIYLCLARLIAIYGQSLSYFSPKAITCFFVACDLFSLVLQATGGAMASTAATHATAQTGINIMIAGLSTQVASTTAFICVAAQLGWNIRRKSHLKNPNSVALRESPKFRFFLWAIGISTLAILIRCCFRVAELSGGFNGHLANNQVSFMVLDGAMMAITVILLTTAHPGWILGSMWKAGSFHFRKSRAVGSPGLNDFANGGVESKMSNLTET